MFLDFSSARVKGDVDVCVLLGFASSMSRRKARQLLSYLTRSH